MSVMSVEVDLQTEIPEGMILTGFAYRILHELELKGFAMWEQDDGEFETIKQLQEIAGNVGYSIGRMVGDAIHDCNNY